MAKLGSYYGLCPLIDQKSLLGISEDGTPGCVIVTLGKNMAIKYKLSDQKQIHSWSTKDKLSSPVIYDKKEKRYVAVFNQLFLRVWTEDDKNLDKIKKIKFAQPLYTILHCDEEPIVVFKNGQAFTLSHAIQNKNEIPQCEVLEKTCVIEDSMCIGIGRKYFVGLLLKNNAEYSFLWMQPNENKMKRIQVSRDGLKMNGHLVKNTEYGPVLLTLWSDGRLYYYPLDDDQTIVLPMFFSVVEHLSRKLSVSMTVLNDIYIAIYGADIEQEGAILQIYNTQFKITQSKQLFKLFTEGSKVWTINGSLLLTVGQNLAVMPYHLDTEQLAALVGSHKLTISDDQDVAIVTEITVGNWGKKTQSIKMPLPVNIASTLKELLSEGWSEFAMCEEIFPKLIEKNDEKTILDCLDYFVDVPENILVKLLSHCLSNETEFVDVINQGLPEGTGKYLDKILTVSYSEVFLIPFLRAELPFDSALVILQYLCFMLSENGHCLCELSVHGTEAKIIEWGCVLIDANYQRLLLSKDHKILESLKYFKLLADMYSVCIEDYRKAGPVLAMHACGHQPNGAAATGRTATLKYSIEKLCLY